jgi:hypothetical protein
MYRRPLAATALGTGSFDRGNEFFYRYIKVLTAH